jgi:hypothetical protein
MDAFTRCDGGTDVAPEKAKSRNQKSEIRRQRGNAERLKPEDGRRAGDARLKAEC